MAEGSLRVIKIPVPNSPHFAITVKGHLVECLEFHAQTFQDKGIVTSQGNQPVKILVSVHMLVIETAKEETHEFVMVHTGEEFPNFDGEIQYVASTSVPTPAGDIEMHLFHAGENPELANVGTPMEGNDG